MAEVGTRDKVFGLLRVNGVDVAVELSALREVVHCPAELATLPATAPGLLGAMELRNLVVPILDLHLNTGPVLDRSQQVVVLIAHDGHLLGVLADAVLAITRVPADDLLPIRASGSLLFSHWFRRPELGGVVSVLDPAALLNLPGVPTVRDRVRPARAAAVNRDVEASGRRLTRTLTVVVCGPHLLALDVEHVYTTVPATAPESSVLTGGVCRGVMTYSGREVPVVDPLLLLGLGELSQDQIGAGIVLDTGSGFVVLAVTSLLDLREVARSAVLALPAVAVTRGDLFDGIALLDGVGQSLVLAGDALRSEPTLVTLGSLNTALDGADAADLTAAVGSTDPGRRPHGRSDELTQALAARQGQEHLAFSAGVEILTPVALVAEILPLPASLTRTNAFTALLGVVVHRSTAVPVLCLPTLLGLPPRPEQGNGCLLLVHAGDQPIAFAVDALRAIVRPTWEDSSEQHKPLTAPEQALGQSPLVIVGERLLPVLDLAALARLVHPQVVPDQRTAEMLLPELTG